MKRRYKILIGIVATILLVPIVFDLTGVVLDNHFENFYMTCVKAKGMPTEWSNDCYEEYNEKHPTIFKISNFMIEPGFGLFVPEFGIRRVLTARCIKTGSKIRGGFTAKGRDYFQCNKVQIFVSDILFGENGERF